MTSLRIDIHIIHKKMVVVHQNMSVKVTVLPTESYNLTRTVLCGVSGRGKGLVGCFINVPQTVGPILQLPCYPRWKGNSPENIQLQPVDIGLPTGNGKKLSCTQAQLGQATGLAVA